MILNYHNIDLQCDCDHSAEEREFLFPESYFGSTLEECIFKARKAGWVFYKDGLRTKCPACVKNKVHFKRLTEERNS